jgi:hypothetical protein
MITTQWLGRFISRSVLALLATGFVAVSEAQAQLTKIFVASFGNDVNDGSRGSPKRNFQAAHNAVAAGGQIVVLDTAGYGQLTITKSLAVTVPPGVNGFVTVTGTNDAITVAAGAGSVVSLRGLIIEGGGNRQSTGNGPGFGIHVTSVGWLSVEDCTIRNFLDALPFAPANGAPYLALHNTIVRNCRYGIDLQGVDNGGSLAVISGCRLENLGDALFATGVVIADLADSEIAQSETAIRIASNAGPVFFYVSNCKFNQVPSGIVGGDTGNSKYVVSYGNNTTSISDLFNSHQTLK